MFVFVCFAARFEACFEVGFKVSLVRAISSVSLKIHEDTNATNNIQEPGALKPAIGD